MTRTIISPLTPSLLCPLLALACDPEDIADSDAELPDDIEGEITPRSNQIPVACQSLTPAALQAPVDKMNEAIGLINEYIATTPESNYPTAGTLALGQINQAKSKITNYQAWLTSINHGNPFVYWVGATPFLEVTDSAHLLHGAAWWAYIAVANDEKEVARLSAKRVFEAQQLASEIGKQALLCAMEQYTNCGDGVLDANEACDDGNAVDGDGCSNTCESDGGTCGNSVVDPGEACDDGNEIDNDGCDLCSSRTPWPLQPQNPCEALTPAAIQRSVELTDEAIEFIDEYLTPPLVTNYTGAGQYTLDSLNQARSKITAHQTYLASIPHGIPFVSQEAVAAETFTAMKGAADWLRYGMWWGFVATAWDHTPSSRMSARRAADAQKLADHLARQALLCSLAPYALCSDGVVNGTEQCDDGNLVAGDGCSSTCTTESVCGDGVVAGAEACDDANTDNTDRCSNTCQVQACPSGGDVKGMWVWNDYVNIVNNSADASELLDFTRSKGVTRLFFDVWDEEAGALLTATTDGRELLADFIADADARCVEVELLVGPKSDTAFSAMEGWMDPSGSVATAIAFAEDAVEFTDALTGPKPVGIHLDIEPAHAPDKGTNMPGVVSRFVDRHYAIADAFEAAQASAGTTLRINADANVWLQHHNITRSGVTKAAHVWLLDRLDATFMDYVDNSTNLIDYVSTEMSYAAGVSGRQVIVGVETMCGLDDGDTFCEEGAAALTSALATVTSNYSANPAWQGVAIHYYESFAELPN